MGNIELLSVIGRTCLLSCFFGVVYLSFESRPGGLHFIQHFIMNYSCSPSKKGVLQQRDNCPSVPPIGTREDQHGHPKQAVSPAYNPSSTQQYSVLQMELPPPSSRCLPSMQPVQLIQWMQRPKFTTSFWEEEGTLCYQVDANSVCVARRQDNDMINGTKLLNVAGLSRGKRDGILKNEKARVVVKIGPMHLKGVWITFNRAKELAHQFKLTELLYPLFLDNPSAHLQNTQKHALSEQSEVSHNISRYKYNGNSTLQASTFRPGTSFMTQSNAYQGVNPTSTAIHTITNMRISDYYRPLNSRYPGLVTHHIYPSYNDSSRSERYSNTHQASVDRFLAQEDYGTNCLDGFPGIPVMRTQENTDFQAAACRFQRPKAEEILLSNSTCHRQLPQEHQCSYYPQQQIIPNGPNSLEFFCPPPTSADNSTPPTPVDSSTTFQFELHSLYGQKNVNHQTPLTSEDDPFVLNSYNQTQQSQDDGLDLYNI